MLYGIPDAEKIPVKSYLCQRVKHTNIYSDDISGKWVIKRILHLQTYFSYLKLTGFNYFNFLNNFQIELKLL